MGHIAIEWGKAGIFESNLCKGRQPYRVINSASVAYISVLLKGIMLLTLLNISASCVFRSSSFQKSGSAKISDNKVLQNRVRLSTPTLDAPAYVKLICECAHLNEICSTG